MPILYVLMWLAKIAHPEALRQNMYIGHGVSDI
jgi:hypothetical protein